MSASFVQDILNTKRYSVQLLQGISDTGANTNANPGANLGTKIYYVLLMKKNLVQKTLKLIEEKKKHPEEVAVILLQGTGAPPENLPSRVKALLEKTSF